MTSSLNLDINEVPKASASLSGSSEDSPEVIAQKKAIIELSNTSVMKGYDLAIDVLVMKGMLEASNELIKSRGMIELGLQNSITGRYLHNE